MLARLRAGRLDEALSLCTKLCASSPRDVQALILKATLHLRSSNIDEAIAACHQALALDNNQSDAYSVMGYALQVQAKHEEAVECFRQALHIQPDNADIHNNLGNILKTQGKTTEAAACFHDALRIDPNHVLANYNLGNLKLTLSDLGGALACLRQVTRFNPRHVEAWFMQGAIHGRLGEFKEAFACSCKATELNPNHADAHYNVAQAYMQMRQRKDAVTSYREVIRLRPDHFDAVNGLGQALQELGQYAEAVECFREAVRLRPDAAAPRYMLAACGYETPPPQAPPDYVRSLFDGYADLFDRHLVQGLEYRAPELLRQALDEFLPSAPATLRILDLGCGTGLCGPLFRGFAQHLVGVDLSPKMLDKARERNVYDELRLGDITAELFEPGTRFDLIIATDVFIYVGDLRSIFKTCRAMLAMGGWFAFSIETLNDGSSYALQPTNRYAHSVAYIRELARAYGFTEALLQSAVLRKNFDRPVDGCVGILRVDTPG